VYEGNHKGSSKAMEGDSFLNLLEYLGVPQESNESQYNSEQKLSEKNKKRNQIEASENEEFILYENEPDDDFIIPENEVFDEESDVEVEIDDLLSQGEKII